MMHQKPVASRLGLALALFLALAVPAPAYEAVTDYRQLRYPELPDTHMPAAKVVTLSSGMRLFLLEDHKLPLIKVSVLIRVGSIYEPADKIGLALITGAVMRSGGTTAKTGDEIDEELESIAASVETGIGLDSGSASVSVLKEDLETGLAVLADILMHPAFPEDKLLLAKTQVRSAIARRNDAAESIASREFGKLIYGPDSVYARQAEYATIDGITRDDLLAFHRRYFGPNNTMMAVWGDFATEAMVKQIEQVFAEWQKVEPVARESPDVRYEYRPAVHLIVKRDVNQASIFLGHIGSRTNDPDYHALTVMNQILGASFTGRLFKNIRSRQGLAYSVGGSYGSHYRHPGTFSIACQTKSESTIHAIRALIDEIRHLQQEEVTAEEFALAKDSYLSSFVFNFDTESQIVNRMMTYEYYGYPLDFLHSTKRGIEAVTRAEVLRAARTHLRPEALQILVVGRPENFDGSLAEFGKVDEMDITIPPLGREGAPAARSPEEKR